MRTRVLRTVRTHQMVPQGGRVLVALSGGADSVALLHVLRELEHDRELVVAGVAHFNHRLRGEAADGDEQFCRTLAGDLGLAADIGSGDVRALARVEHRSIEDAARRARYAFLDAAADRARADAIAVGHSLDDQAETFLLRLIRGAGPRGLAGIRPKAGRIVRPLIEISRQDLRAYAAERQLAFREDETNRDLSVPRNRVRHELLPILQRFSPALVEVLAREAGIAREDEDFLSRAAIDLASRIVLSTNRGIEIDLEGLRDLHPAIAARVVREALDRAAPGRFFGHGHIRSALAAASGLASTPASVPGLVVSNEAGRLILSRGDRPLAEPFSNSFHFPLSIPGEVSLPGWSVSARRLDDIDAGERRPRLTMRMAAPAARPGGDGAVMVAASELKLPLAVRSRRRGDRFRPLGMRGRGRKLQDVLVDRKVPRIERDTLPLVVDSDDRIVWVVGQSIAEDFRVTGPSQGVILLKARRLGGEG